MTRRREKPVRFEIMRLDHVDGTTVDSTVVDAASVNQIVQQAAAIGQRLWIRPADTPPPHKRRAPPSAKLRSPPYGAPAVRGGFVPAGAVSPPRPHAPVDHLRDAVDDLLHGDRGEHHARQSRHQHHAAVLDDPDDQQRVAHHQPQHHVMARIADHTDICAVTLSAFCTARMTDTIAPGAGQQRHAPAGPARR